MKKFDALPFDEDGNDDDPWLDLGPFAAWRTQARVALVALLGTDHPYTVHFDEVRGRRISEARGGRALLQAVREDIENGDLFESLTGLLTAEVFNDFLSMAEHLLEQGYKDAAAAQIGAVLENGLRRIATKAGTSGSNLGKLNDACLAEGVYSRLVHQQVTVWIATRNKAA
ncbi:MAG TPA: hypothetical protein VHT97_08440, partial [Acidimicrobiales bacterium]|nr:hypothetical protein [Acidimicrobiales bacterium]